MSIEVLQVKSSTLKRMLAFHLVKRNKKTEWFGFTGHLPRRFDVSTAKRNSMSLLQNLECRTGQISTTPYDLANLINQTFLEPVKLFDPLPSSFINRNTVEDPQLTNQSLCTSEFSVFKLLASLN